jgi:hypothetical protein
MPEMVARLRTQSDPPVRGVNPVVQRFPETFDFRGTESARIQRDRMTLESDLLIPPVEAFMEPRSARPSTVVI